MISQLGSLVSLCVFYNNQYNRQVTNSFSNVVTTMTELAITFENVHIKKHFAIQKSLFPYFATYFISGICLVMENELYVSRSKFYWEYLSSCVAIGYTTPCRQSLSILRNVCKYVHVPMAYILLSRYQKASLLYLSNKNKIQRLPLS